MHEPPAPAPDSSASSLPPVSVAGSASPSLWQRLTLIRRDLVRHWRAGQPRCVEDYLAHLPELRDDREALLDLLELEWLLREERGERPDADDFARRFPDCSV